MKRLILTTNDSGSGALKGARIADAVIGFGDRFVWGPLPSDAEIATSLMPLSSQYDQAGDHWLLRVYRKHLGDVDSHTSLIDLCEHFDAIELWIDPDPNAQLILIWLLDYLRSHEKIVSKLSLVQADTPIGSHLSEGRRVADTRHQDAGWASRSSWLGLAGLARADAAGLGRSFV
jgi:hypothetical protein